ncbi:restriction endonuclease subunit S [Microbulbifer sp. SSSA002]|uniref:restriction endonuclease subunit S n=1 Tax=Microbulbifer sp. SSSA002 TaxID=3243376 RepID=UPI00403A1BAA
MSAEQLITENLELWTSAVKAKKTQGRGSNSKRELYGIKKLRELILELAVRGKLVPQDPNDEPASVLLERIAAEKELLIKEKKIKKTKKLSAPLDTEPSFPAPQGWSWTTIDDFCEIGPKNNLRDEDKASFVPMPLIHTNIKGSHGQEIRNWSEIKKGYTHFADGDIAIAKITPCFENSKAAIFSGLINGYGTGTTELHVARPITNDINRFFILLHLKSPQFLKLGESKMTGSAGQKRVPREYFAHTYLALPPLAEQNRIVAKVDQLMALCDQLEQQTEASLDAHQQLVDTLLATLTSAQDAEELKQNWARLSEHFDTLITTDYAVEQLKQTILQLAVMGKLVPQDPNDEPASVLLDRIAAEKAQLIKEKKIKKQKPLPEIGDEEKPFELPTGWEWSHLGNFSNIKGGYAYKSGDFLMPTLFQVIRMGNIRPDKLRVEEKPAYISSILAESTESYKIIPGDILLTMTGTKGKRDYLYSLMVNDSDVEERTLFLNQRLCNIQTLLVSKEYIIKALKEDRLLDKIYEKSTGTANQANIGMDAISKWVLPIPPLKEQHRIAVKVDQLMLLCNSLKKYLAKIKKIQLSATDAICEYTQS